jgi:hypothetical protein
MGSDNKQSGPPKFQFYNSETGELLGRNGASWRKYTLSFGFKIGFGVEYIITVELISLLSSQFSLFSLLFKAHLKNERELEMNVAWKTVFDRSSLLHFFFELVFISF